jgi:hypothetical protein
MQDTVMNRIVLISLLSALPLVPLAAGEVYVRDGVTDGDTFYLADSALHDDDPVLQSWVSYSLTRSTCQLQIGGDNPARASSFECEFIARRHLIESWREKRDHDATHDDSSPDHEYLDALLSVDEAGFLAEYVAHYFSRRSWQLPDDLRTREFHEWRRVHLRRHEPQTRLIGSWNYAHKVGPGIE